MPEGAHRKPTSLRHIAQIILEGAPRNDIRKLVSDGHSLLFVDGPNDIRYCLSDGGLYR